MKRAFNLAGATSSATITFVILVTTLIRVIGFGKLPFFTEEDIVQLSLAIIILALNILTCLVLAFCLTFFKSSKVKGFIIALIPLMAVTGVFAVITADIIEGIACLIPVALLIAALCVKAEKENADCGKMKFLFEKTNELKHLKEQKILSAEQFDEALKNLVDGID